MDIILQILSFVMLVGGGAHLICLGLLIIDISSWEVYLPAAIISLICASGALLLFFILSAIAEDKSNALEYDSFTKKLTVHNIKPKNMLSIKVVSVKNYYMKYHPSETIYTGATVGGIHTGGFHQTKAYHSTEAYNTGKAKLIYKNVWDANNTGPIEEIEFDEELMKKLFIPMSIEKFRCGNCLVLNHSENSKIYDAGIQASLNQKNYTANYEILKQAVVDKQLTFLECIKIKLFIIFKRKKTSQST